VDRAPLDVEDPAHHTADFFGYGEQRSSSWLTR
jgi:hypothetical protein